MEWKTDGTGRRPVALLQLATLTFVLLVRLCFMPYTPQPLQQLLQDASIIKTGVNIRTDVQYLYEDYGILVAMPFWDLSHFAETKGFSLERAVYALCGCSLWNKNKAIAMSD